VWSCFQHARTSVQCSLYHGLAERSGHRTGIFGSWQGPPGEGDAAPYATPLRGPAPLPGREKSGVGGTGIMTGETGCWGP
jgi:hypothetical protein